MSVLTTLKDIWSASTESPDRDDLGVKQSKGAYWCDDCAERLSEVEVEGGKTPTCPDCGERMEFEPSPPTTGCGC